MAPRSIDPLRLLLDHLDGERRADQLAFFLALLEAGPEAVRELDGRLPGSRAPRALRRLAMEASFYHPWPGWVAILQRMLRYETDYDIFLTGVRALGRIGNGEALEALRELNALRQGEPFTGTLAEVLSETDPREAFNHYFGRLLQGSASAAVANEAAQRLMPLVDASNIEALRTLTQHPDLLVFRHALTLLAHIDAEEAAEALEAIFQESCRELISDRQLKEALAALRGMAPAAAAEVALAALAGDQEGEPRKPGEPALGPSRTAFDPVLSDFHHAVLVAAQEGRAGALGSVLLAAAEDMHGRGRRLGFALDATAEGLAELVARGRARGPAVLAMLVQAYGAQVGREGLARAIARLVPAGAGEIHRLLLGAPDAAQRAAAVEALGQRADPELQPVLLQACRDPLSDIADRACFFLGQLPDAEDLISDLLHALTPEDFQLGLRLAAEHRCAALVPDLLALLRGATREDLAVQLIEALGAIAVEAATEPLLALLHSGQSARMQIALAQALRAMGTLDAALALAAKADAIKQPFLHAIAVEALAGARPGADAAILLEQVRGAWDDRNPWPLRLRVVQALQGLDREELELWRDLARLLGDALAQKRPANAWSGEELRLVQAAAREFARRAG